MRKSESDDELPSRLEDEIEEFDESSIDYQAYGHHNLSTVEEMY